MLQKPHQVPSNGAWPVNCRTGCRFFKHQNEAQRPTLNTGVGWLGRTAGSGAVMADFSAASRFFGIGRHRGTAEPDPADVGTAFGMELSLDQQEATNAEAPSETPRKGWLHFGRRKDAA